jgi:hypothetical protein
MIAARHVATKVDLVTADAELRSEFKRDGRFWPTLFSRYEQFRNFYDGSVARILAGPVPSEPQPKEATKAPSTEVDPAVKAEVFERDNRQCLACETKRIASSATPACSRRYRPA